MPIVIKEVIVKTTVERPAPQWLDTPFDKVLIEDMKRQVIAELSVDKWISKPNRDKKNR